MRDEFKNTEKWHKRGYIPHYEAEEKFQFLTYRLADSLPKNITNEFSQTGYEELTAEQKIKKHLKIEKVLDKGYGSCILAKPECAEITVNGHIGVLGTVGTVVSESYPIELQKWSKNGQQPTDSEECFFEGRH